jgi:hypothetical protein
MIRSPPFTGKEKDDKPNLPIDFGVNYAIELQLYFLYYMFKPEYQL